VKQGVSVWRCCGGNQTMYAMDTNPIDTFGFSDTVVLGQRVCSRELACAGSSRRWRRPEKCARSEAIGALAGVSDVGGWSRRRSSAYDQSPGQSTQIAILPQLNSPTAIAAPLGANATDVGM